MTKLCYTNLAILTMGGVALGIVHFLINKLPKTLGFYDGLGNTLIWTLGIPIILHVTTVIVTLGIASILIPNIPR